MSIMFSWLTILLPYRSWCNYKSNSFVAAAEQEVVPFLLQQQRCGIVCQATLHRPRRCRCSTTRWRHTCSAWLCTTLLTYLASSFTWVSDMPHGRTLMSTSTEQLDVLTCRRSLPMSWHVSVATLNVVRSGTWSQWRLISVSVMWSQRLKLKWALLRRMWVRGKSIRHICIPQYKKGENRLLWPTPREFVAPVGADHVRISQISVVSEN